MKIAMIGSQDFKSLEKVAEKLRETQKNKWYPQFRVISGGAPGVDQEVEKWCKEHGVDIEVIRPIKPYIGAYYLYRDVEIAIKCDRMTAFWNGVSRGTKFTIDYARARGKEVKVIRE